CAYPSCMSLAAEDLRCSRCKAAYYCSRVHQLNDARRHQRSQCQRTTQPTSASSRTSPETRTISVLLFPTDEPTPRIVRTECKIDATDPSRPGEEHHTIDFQTLLRPTSAVVSLPVAPVERRPPALGPPTRLYLAFDDSFALPPTGAWASAGSGGARLNRAAERLTAGAAHVRWRGALLGYRAREPAAGRTQFEDVTMADLPAFVAFLREH
ncbi:hypothetical protein C8Q79DRAFT_893570, partial [Trametes meyenii]